MIAARRDHTEPVSLSMDKSERSGAESPFSFDDVIKQELIYVNNARTQKGIDHLQQIRFNAVGLAFSGGGIRAATFHLGFLQSLAKKGSISRFDYLSAVSGGAYIAAWLGGLLRNCSLGQVMKLLDPSNRSVESPQITHLRDYSNYLTPRLGLFSPHVWTFIATYLRNLLVTFVLVMLPVVAFLLLPRLFGAYIEVALAGKTPFWICEAAAFGLIVANLWKALLPFLRQRGRPENDRGIFYSRVCFAWLFGCLLSIGLIVHFHRDILDLVTILRGRTSLNWLVSIFQTVEKVLGPPTDPRTVWQRPINWVQASGILLAVVSVAIMLVLFLQDNLERIARPRQLKYPRLVMAISANTLFLLFLYNRFHAVHDWIQLRFQTLDTATASIVVATWALPVFLVASVFVMAPLDAMIFGFLLPLKRPGKLRKPRVMLFQFKLPRRLAHWRSRFHSPKWLRRVNLDLLQEHLSRTYGAILVYAVCTVVVSLTALYGPYVVLRALDGKTWIVGLTIWSIGSVIGLLVVFRPRLRSVESDWFMFWVARLLPYWFAGLPILTVSWLLHSLMLGFGSGDWSWYASGVRLTFSPRITYYLLFMCFFGHALASCAGVNRYSMHSFYRTRLVQCYLLPRLMRAWSADEIRESGNIRAESRSRKVREDLALSGLNRVVDNGGPVLLFNAALNVSSRSRLAWQERRTVGFTMSSLFCGYSGIVASSGGELTRIEAFRPTHDYMVDNERITCGFAMATSGAAISPTVAFQGTPRFNVLMSILNLRLGVWVPNPQHPSSWNREMPRSLIHFLLREFTGQMEHDGSFIHLSDGGHFENLGLYELVRRRCRTIVVSDATEDSGDVFKGVAVAIERVRVDFGVEIDLDLTPIRCAAGKSHVVIGRINYPDGASGNLVYCRASITGDEPLDVQSYAIRHPAFPNQSTMNQWFGETQFEAYRRLGEHVGDEAADRLATLPDVGS